MSIRITQFLVGGFDKNCSYVMQEDESNECLIVDPSGDMTTVYTYISINNLTVNGVALTHSHHDHFDALQETQTRFNNVPIYVHQKGEDSIGSYGEIIALTDSDCIPLGGKSILVLYTPGHTQDSICFYLPASEACDEQPHIITGDTLFVGGCGRTNEEGVAGLYQSLERLRKLPANTHIYPGHDYGATPTSTIGAEIAHNRFYQVMSFEDFYSLRLT